MLGRWLEDGDFPDRIMATAEVSDRAFVMELVYGCVRWKRMLEYLVERLTQRTPQPELLPFLYVGLYQLLRMDTIASHAAVYETVEAAKQDGLVSSAGFLNAVLRRVLRERDSIRTKLAATSLGIRQSHPDLLVSRWTRQFGEKDTEDLCVWNNERPRVVICPDPVRAPMAEFQQRLTQADMPAEPHPFSPDRCLVMVPGVRVPDIPGYDEGHFTVQDPSTLVAIDLLDPQPGEKIMDACAAPGGKTMLIAARMQDAGQLVAVDLHDDRMGPLRENVARMRRTCVRIVQADAALAEPVELDGCRMFDRVLIDAPCTNTGVLRRRPDARWRFGKRRMVALVDTQRRLLDACATRVKPGGRLVYSTCSLEPDEGPRQVATWLKAHPEFALANEKQLFPPTTRTDGAYVAALDRVGWGAPLPNRLALNRLAKKSLTRHPDSIHTGDGAKNDAGRTHRFDHRRGRGAGALPDLPAGYQYSQGRRSGRATGRAARRG